MARITNWLTEYFDVLEKSTTKDSGGAIIPSYSTVLESQLGKIDKLSGREVETLEKKGISATHRLFCTELPIWEDQYVLAGLILHKVVSVDDTLLRGSNPHYEVLLEYQDQYSGYTNESGYLYGNEDSEIYVNEKGVA